MRKEKYNWQAVRKKTMESKQSDFFVKNVVLDFIAAYQLLHKEGPNLNEINYANIGKLPTVIKLIHELINEKWVYEVNGHGIRYQTDIFE